MAKELPYLPTYKNVGKLFEKIKSAKIPDVFTHNYLLNTIGLKSTGDRSLISLLKQLGFLDNDGKPTQRYSALKNDKISAIEIARGIKEAYAPLFEANERADLLDNSELKGLVAQVSGADNNTASKILGTFKALLPLGDFESDNTLKMDEAKNESPKAGGGAFSDEPPPLPQNMKPEFHYNIQIHLPSNGNEETYINIFNAVRKVFK